MGFVQRALRLGPLENNSYVIVDEATRESAVVDVGFEPEAVVEALAAERLTPRWLLATHGHYDHVAGMREVQDAVGGVFRLHPADRPLLDMLAAQGAAFGFPPATPPENVVDLADDEQVPLGAGVLRVLHTPGHSPGHVCFHAGPDLWVGDLLFAGSVGRTDLPGGSFAQLERSVHTRVFPLGDDVRCWTGHGAPTTVGEERRHNPFVGSSAGRP